MYFVAILNGVFDKPFSVFDEHSVLVVFGESCFFESSRIKHKTDFLFHKFNELFRIGSEVAMQHMDEPRKRDKSGHSTSYSWYLIHYFIGSIKSGDSTSITENAMRMHTEQMLFQLLISIIIDDIEILVLVFGLIFFQVWVFYCKIIFFEIVLGF